MHASRNELPILLELNGVSFRGMDMGDLRATVNSFPAGLEATPFLRGLPGDRCHCPHWGYVVKGRLRVSYADGEETYVAGDLYFMPPGHTLLVEEDAELVEFSPRQQMDEVGEALRRNFAAGGGMTGQPATRQR